VGLPNKTYLVFWGTCPSVLSLLLSGLTGCWLLLGTAGRRFCTV